MLDKAFPSNMKLILTQVAFFGVLASLYVSAKDLTCYVCKSDLDETHHESCDLAHEKHVKTCDNLIPHKACKTEWRRDKNQVLIWVKRSCENVISEALSGNKCDDDGRHTRKCLCKSDKCNNQSFMDPAWKDSSYRYPISPIQILFIILTSLAAVTLFGILIWWCVKLRRKRRNRAVAPDEPEQESEIAGKPADPVPEIVSDSGQEVGQSDSGQFKVDEEEAQNQLEP